MKIFLSLLLLFPYYSFAEGTINDYAYAYKLNIDNENPIYSFYLPQEVYESIIDANYADVRIFNADKVSVPYLLEHETTQIEQASTDYNISFFPMFFNTKNSIEATSININTRQNGTVINVTPNNNQLHKNNSLLLDLSQFDVKPTTFTLLWDKEHTDFNQVITVSGSDDLATWSNIKNNVPLTNLHFSKNHLIKNNIELPKNTWKYLRLNWAGELNLKFKNVIGQSRIKYLDQTRQTINLLPNKYDNKTKSFFYYNNGRFPIDRISVKLKPKNSLLNISISSSDSINGPWVTRHNGIAYNLKQNGKVISSDVIKIYTTNHHYWRITAKTERDNLASFTPNLELGWLAHNLIFIAEGNPPFIIAFGNNDAIKDNTARSVSKLIRQQEGSEKIKKAEPELASRLILGGEERLQAKTLNNINIKKIILWSVLILGLVILSMMAWQLYKQMNTNES